MGRPKKYATEEERLEARRAQNRLHGNNFYANHKKEVLELRKIQYQTKKAKNESEMKKDSSD